MINNKNNRHISVEKNKGKLFISLFLMGTAFSQSFAQYEIKKHTINSGGTTLTGGSFQMQASIGQVDASKPITGGNFSLNSGFWQENNDLIFKNNFE